MKIFHVRRPTALQVRGPRTFCGAKPTPRDVNHRDSARPFRGWEPCEACLAMRDQPQPSDTVRCPNHRDGGATRCPRGGPALQAFQRRMWGD